MDFDDPMLERGYSGSRAYGQSKLAQITTGFELADRARPERGHGDEPAPLDLHADEDGARGARAARSTRSRTASRRPSRLAVDPELEGVTGRFYDRQRESRADPQASDARAAPAALGAVARARSASPSRRSRPAPAPGTPRGSGRTARRRRAARCRRAARRATAPPQAGPASARIVRSGSSAAPRTCLEAPAPDLQPRTDRHPAGGRRPPRTRRAGTASSSAITNASGPRSASPPGNGARLPHAPSPMTSGSSSCPHAVSS